MNGRCGFDLYAKIFVLCARIRLLRDSCPRIRKQARRTQDYSHLTGRAGWIVRDGHVGQRSAAEAACQDGRGIRADGKLEGWGEQPLAEAEEYRHTVRSRVGHGDVWIAVRIE